MDCDTFWTAVDLVENACEIVHVALIIYMAVKTLMKIYRRM